MRSKVCLFILSLIVGLIVLTGAGSQAQRGSRKPPKPKPSPTVTPTPTPTVSPSPSPVPTVTPTPVPTPALIGDAWSTYGHDARRSFAALQGSIPGPLTTKWRYVPARTYDDVSGVFNMLASSDALYLRYHTLGGGTFLEKVSHAGSRVWWSGPCCNWDKQHWVSLSPDGTKIYSNDDGLFLTDTATGKTVGTNTGAAPIDTWGDTVADPNGLRWYTVNMRHQKDPAVNQEQMYVGAFSPSGGKVWHGAGASATGTAMERRGWSSKL